MVNREMMGSVGLSGAVALQCTYMLSVWRSVYSPLAAGWWLRHSYCMLDDCIKFQFGISLFF